MSKLQKSPQNHMQDVVSKNHYTIHPLERRHHCPENLYRSVMSWLGQIPSRRNISNLANARSLVVTCTFTEVNMDSPPTTSCINSNRASIEPTESGFVVDNWTRSPYISSRTDSLVKQPDYSDCNLALDHIILVDRKQYIPNHIRRVHEIGDRDFPESSESELADDMEILKKFGIVMFIRDNLIPI